MINALAVIKFFIEAKAIFFYNKFIFDQHLLSDGKSIFSNHLLKPIHNSPIFINPTHLVWPIYIIFLLLSLNIYLIYLNPKKYVEVIIRSFQFQNPKSIFNEDYNLNKRYSIILTFNFILLLSFILLKLNHYFDSPLWQYQASNYQYLFFVILILFGLLFKYLITYIFAFCLNLQRHINDYFFSALNIYYALSIILFPIVIFLYYSSISSYYFLYPICIICLSFYILRLFVTTLYLISQQKISFIQIIMYLCALEILPLLVLIKFLFINF
jgi:hypothetical protein